MRSSMLIYVLASAVILEGSRLPDNVDGDSSTLVAAKAWLDTNMREGKLLADLPNRRMLFSLLSMLATQNKFPDLLDTAGLPAASEVPSACPELELGADKGAWLLRQGSQHALVDKQQLAKFLSDKKPHREELLKEYAKLWEPEWRQNQSSITEGCRDKQRNLRDTISTLQSGKTPEDKSNGSLFASALRSFFANELRLAQLEHDPVLRIIEAFAGALASDEAFMECFSRTMLPDSERKAYKRPEDVIFCVTYSTMMLNTDMHNKEVREPATSKEKFREFGKTCGVTAGLMLKIFKNIKEEEL